MIFLESKYRQNHGQCSEKVEGASDGADFFHGENLDHPEKKNSNSPLDDEIGLLK